MAVIIGAIAVVLIAVAVVVFSLARRPGPPTAAPTTATSSASPSPTPTPRATTKPPSLPELPPGAMNILVLGSDIRGSAQQAVQSQAASGGIADERSDMIMLIHVPADRSKVYGISIMRDNWVAIPGYANAKINASLSLGGPPLVVATVESLLKTHIDHYVMTDFDGFKAIVDVLGGVTVDVTRPFTATFDTHHAFTPGPNKLDGQAALEFVRERYAFPDGDFQRVRDQQTFVRSLIVQLLSTGTVRDASSAIAIIAVAAPHLVVDQHFDPTTLAALAYALRGVDPASSVFFTLPTAGTGTSPDGQSIVVPDYRGIAEVSAALASDGLAAYAAAHHL
ncbi:LCP family protein [Sinomonas terricola]|uniref:LCP family protein n=1 Tax=Sinomonas terricola TaxID=3110330 RepID=UPI002B1EBC9C|nr:LCP family protein [Sinomonas sp. JGH33]